MSPWSCSCRGRCRVTCAVSPPAAVLWIPAALNTACAPAAGCLHACFVGREAGGGCCVSAIGCPGAGGGVSQRASVSLCGVWSPPGEGICSPEHVVGSEQGLGWKGPLEPSGPIPRHEQRRGPLCFSVVLWVGGWPLRTRPARPPRGSVGDHYDRRPSWCHGWRC